jgi:hypothetical protein
LAAETANSSDIPVSDDVYDLLVAQETGKKGVRISALASTYL